MNVVVQSPGFTLASWGAAIYAVNPPWYVEIPALGMVGLVLWILLRREKVSHDETQHQIAMLDARLTELDEKYSKERHLKHEALNRIAVVENTMRVVKSMADTCTCGALDRIAPLLDQVMP